MANLSEKELALEKVDIEALLALVEVKFVSDMDRWGEKDEDGCPYLPDKESAITDALEEAELEIIENDNNEYILERLTNKEYEYIFSILYEKFDEKEVLAEIEEAKLFNKDPLGYYGMSERDFL